MNGFVIGPKKPESPGGWTIGEKPKTPEAGQETKESAEKTPESKLAKAFEITGQATQETQDEISRDLEMPDLDDQARAELGELQGEAGETANKLILIKEEAMKKRGVESTDFSGRASTLRTEAIESAIAFRARVAPLFEKAKSMPYKKEKFTPQEIDEIKKLANEIRSKELDVLQKGNELIEAALSQGSKDVIAISDDLMEGADRINVQATELGIVGSCSGGQEELRVTGPEVSERFRMVKNRTRAIKREDQYEDFAKRELDRMALTDNPGDDSRELDESAISVLKTMDGEARGKGYDFWADNVMVGAIAKAQERSVNFDMIRQREAVPTPQAAE